MPQDEDVFPIVAHAEGSISEDGCAVLIRLQTIGHGPVHCGLKITDPAAHGERHGISRGFRADARGGKPEAKPGAVFLKRRSGQKVDGAYR